MLPEIDSLPATYPFGQLRFSAATDAHADHSNAGRSESRVVSTSRRDFNSFNRRLKLFLSAGHLACPNEPPRHSRYRIAHGPAATQKGVVAPRRTAPITTAETNLVIA